MEILEQAFAAIESFHSFSHDEREAVLAKTRHAAVNGHFEPLFPQPRLSCLERDRRTRFRRHSHITGGRSQRTLASAGRKPKAAAQRQLAGSRWPGQCGAGCAYETSPLVPP